MESLDKIMTEESVLAVSEKIMNDTKDKIVEQVSTAFYNQVESFLYEHYQNHKDKIEKELIAQISEQFVNDPASYKYKALRDKIFLENRNNILNTLTDESIEQGMESILLQRTALSNYFHWQWKDGIAQLIINSWDKFKDDERIASKFGREIENLKSQNAILRERLASHEYED